MNKTYQLEGFVEVCEDDEDGFFTFYFYQKTFGGPEWVELTEWLAHQVFNGPDGAHTRVTVEVLNDQP